MGITVKRFLDDYRILKVRHVNLIKRVIKELIDRGFSISEISKIMDIPESSIRFYKFK